MSPASSVSDATGVSMDEWNVDSTMTVCLSTTLDIDDVSSNTSSIRSFWHPEFVPVSHPTFRWGNHDGESFLSIVKDAYMKVIKWRRILFCVPSGNVGKSFV